MRSQKVFIGRWTKCRKLQIGQFLSNAHSLDMAVDCLLRVSTRLCCRFGHLVRCGVNGVMVWHGWHGVVYSVP